MRDRGDVLNPSGAWLQPPAFVTQMISRNYLPRVVDATVGDDGGDLSVVATRSADGSTLVLQVVNVAEDTRPSRIDLEGFSPDSPEVVVEELAGPLDATNTAEEPTRIEPKRRQWQHGAVDGVARYTFPPHSFTILRFE